MRRPAALFARFALSVLLFVFVLFPNPVLLFKQVHTFMNIGDLVDEKFEGVEEARALLDARLKPGMSEQQTLKAVEAFVYEHIKYTHDWEQWLNFDYWPRAEEVWRSKREDCDGQAVLAASLLRSLGIKAEITGNYQHIWVKVDQEPIMRPMKETNITTDKSGKTSLNLPSTRVMLKTIRSSIKDFPAYRLYAFLFLSFVVFAYPRGFHFRFAIEVGIATIGFVLMIAWARSKTGFLAHDALFFLAMAIMAVVYSKLLVKVPR